MGRCSICNSRRCRCVRFYPGPVPMCSDDTLENNRMYYRLIQPEVEGWQPRISDDEYIETSRGRELSDPGPYA